ncbi:putative ATP-dependent RNA helicase DRS1 [Blattamonas nauphoetae]|uniref:ATP-dependent RNA helicase DRS1 n=1 Tax=Blattamonas nauphoetae TaxID=2049346 RepID=A0ABQ9YHY6_9EUKA|nr:putative ATP-dependent RNA helicase DRS1 [Blattamonas nauphoetae]
MTDFTALPSPDDIDGEMENPTQLDDPNSTLNEPIRASLLRDFGSIGKKLLLVIKPSRHTYLYEALKDWDLWGPLLIGLVLGSFLALRAPEKQAGFLFSAFFVIMWLGAFCVTANVSLLKGKLSFFQSMSVLGYCVSPFALSAIISYFVNLFASPKVVFVVKLVATIIAYVWSLIATYPMFKGVVESNKTVLVIYPLCLFYFALGWLVVIKMSSRKKNQRSSIAFEAITQDNIVSDDDDSDDDDIFFNPAFFQGISTLHNTSASRDPNTSLLRRTTEVEQKLTKAINDSLSRRIPEHEAERTLKLDNDGLIAQPQTLPKQTISKTKKSTKKPSSPTPTNKSEEIKDSVHDYQAFDDDDSLPSLLPPPKTTQALDTSHTFTDLGISSIVVHAVRKELSFDHPTPIQTQAIEASLRGNDVLCVAPTGSGKTCAFLIPMFEHLLRKNGTIVNGQVTRQKSPDGRLRALILSPTRELALQTLGVCQTLIRSLPSLSVEGIIGGLPRKAQETILKSESLPTILVATPGRLVDLLLNTQSVAQRLDKKNNLMANTTFLVLDEADRLLEEGFRKEVDTVLSMLPGGEGVVGKQAHLSSKGKQSSQSNQRGMLKPQTILTTATKSSELTDLAERALRQPVLVSVDARGDEVSSTTNQFAIVQGLVQEVVFVSTEQEREISAVALIKNAITPHQPKTPQKSDDVLSGVHGGSVLVFTRTRERCHRFAVLLRLLNVNAMELHGGLTMGQRLWAMECFKRGVIEGDSGEVGTAKRGVCRVLVCTDLAARGLDIDNVGVVLSLDEPKRLRDYVHRAGRTARIGRKGRTVTIFKVQRKQVEGGSEMVIPRVLAEMNNNSPGLILERKIKKKEIGQATEEVEGVKDDLERLLREEEADQEMVRAEEEIDRAEKLVEGTSERREWILRKGEKEKDRKKAKEAEEKERMTGTRSRPEDEVISKVKRLHSSRSTFDEDHGSRAESKRFTQHAEIWKDERGAKQRRSGKTPQFEKEDATPSAFDIPSRREKRNPRKVQAKSQKTSQKKEDALTRAQIQKQARRSKKGMKLQKGGVRPKPAKMEVKKKAKRAQKPSLKKK